MVYPLFGKTLKLNAEYYHTRFIRQAVIDYDSDQTMIHVTNLDGKSYSNTVQIDATYPVVSGLELTAAWRLNDVKCTYGGKLMEKPLTSRYKGLITASYKTPLGLWQFDVTLQLNGGGRMPNYIDHSTLNIEHDSSSESATNNGQWSMVNHSQLTSRCLPRLPAGSATSLSMSAVKT